MMAKIFKLSLLFLLPMVFTGCATVQNYQIMARSWQGQSLNNLVAQWGYPDKHVKAPNGDGVYVYKQESIEQTPAMITPQFTTVNTDNGNTTISQTGGTYMPGRVYHSQCSTWFQYNKHKIITQVRFRGNSCALTDRELRSNRAHMPPADIQ